MKKLLVVILIVLFGLLTVSYSKPTWIDPLDIQFSGLYPEWFRFSEKEKQARIRMYIISEHKYNWFPELHSRPSNVLCFDKSVRIK